VFFQYASFRQPFQKKRHQEIGNGILHKPVQVEVTPENTTVEAIIQSISLCKREKTELIIKLITRKLATDFSLYRTKQVPIN
jgi:excinuclease UvrABC helicase subunit UvrB